jgi:HD-GYP domain-containing protein (c-di-GMP phosphodiesterase class II)
MGMEGTELARLTRSAEMHDIGKLAIPDAILHKPGPLNEAELRFVRSHTTVGERILSASPALSHVGAIVRASHERWDGSGYPDGRKGDEIPLAARIVAVCDAYAAMTSDRPHSPAMSPGAALADLRAAAGTQFDPAVIEAFAGLPEGVRAGHDPRPGSVHEHAALR